MTDVETWRSMVSKAVTKEEIEYLFRNKPKDIDKLKTQSVKFTESSKDKFLKKLIGK